VNYSFRRQKHHHTTIVSPRPHDEYKQHLLIVFLFQSLLYGTKTQYLSTSDDPFTHELYRSTDESLKMKDPKIVRVQSKPNATFMGMFGAKKFNPALKPPVAAAKPKTASSTPTASGTDDAALAQLQNSLATENARKAENT
jgi:RNA polymerase II elongation factor ELL